MRIVWVLPGIGMTGGVRIVIEYANRLAAGGHDVSILTLRGGSGDPCFPMRVPVSEYSAEAAKGADALLATGWQTVEPVVRAEAVTRKYYFIQNRESYFRKKPWQQWAVEQYYRSPLIPITISHWLADVLRIHGRDSFVIHNGLDTGLFAARPDMRGDGYRILIEGQHAQWKRTALAMHAARRVDGAEVWVLTGGKGPEGADRYFYNAIGSEVPEIYSSCHAMIKMSDFEGYPGPHAEAMACGCAVVTSDVPGVNEYCLDGINCLSVPSHDVEAAARALTRLRDSGYRDRIVQGGFATVRERFTWEDKVAMLEAVLSGTIGSDDLPCPYHSAEEIADIRRRSRPYNLPLFQSLSEMGRFTPRRSSRLLNRVCGFAARLSERHSLGTQAIPGRDTR